MVAEPAVARTHWGVVVTSMDGEPIFALNEGQLFQPASNTKLFTTAAALALIKSGSHFKTLVLAQATPETGTLRGNLVLRGDGDAYLSNRAVPYAAPKALGHAPVTLPPLHVLDEMADQIAATGLKTIDGDIVGDDTLFPWEPYAPDWAADDLLWGYGAPVSALAISDNQLRLTITPWQTSTGPRDAPGGRPHTSADRDRSRQRPSTPFRMTPSRRTQRAKLPLESNASLAPAYCGSTGPSPRMQRRRCMRSPSTIRPSIRPQA